MGKCLLSSNYKIRMQKTSTLSRTSKLRTKVKFGIGKGPVKPLSPTNNIRKTTPLTDCVEIWYALGGPLVTHHAVVTGGVSLHVRTCRDTPPPHTHRASVSRKGLDRLCSNLVCGLGGHYLSAFHKSLVECICTCARAHPFSINVPLVFTQ